MAPPLVSFVLTNYNYGALLAEAIDSALAQTWERTEVVVVDDGSTDDSRAVLDRYRDRIRAVLQENAGQAAAFNAGFAASRGDVVCLLDSDDISYPERAERLVRAFERWPRAEWIRHQLEVVDDERRPIGRRLPVFRPAGPVAPVPQRFIESQVRAVTSGIAFRRELGLRTFPLPTEIRMPDGVVSLARDADAYLTFRFGAVGGWYGTLAEVLGEYRRHAAQHYAGVEDLETMLRRLIELGSAAATAFDDAIDGDTTPTTVHKHRAILAALHGAPLLSRDRLGAAWRGWVRARWLIRAAPLLAARQSLAIAWALLFPGPWARRVLREQGFER